MGSDGTFAIPAEGIRITHLTAGSYALKEKTAPDGYIITRDPAVEFVLSGGEIFSVNGKLSDSDGKALILNIPNSPGAELPSAGGPGAASLTLAGVLTLTGAALFWGWTRRREA